MTCTYPSHKLDVHTVCDCNSLRVDHFDDGLSHQFVYPFAEQKRPQGASHIIVKSTPESPTRKTRKARQLISCFRRHARSQLLTMVKPSTQAAKMAAGSTIPCSRAAMRAPWRIPFRDTRCTSRSCNPNAKFELTGLKLFFTISARICNKPFDFVIKKVPCEDQRLLPPQIIYNRSAYDALISVVGKAVVTMTGGSGNVGLSVQSGMRSEDGSC